MKKTFYISLLLFICLVNVAACGNKQKNIYNGFSFSNITLCTDDGVRHEGYSINSYNGDEINLVIPNYINELPVIVLNGAFKDNVILKSVILPDTLLWIYGAAFNNCSKLEHVIIPDSVQMIGSDAFKGCSSLTNIVIPNSVTRIGADAFAGCSNLTSITIPFVGASLNETEYTTFGYIFGNPFSDFRPDDYPATIYYGVNCGVPNSLKEVIITESSSLGKNAFANCNRLTSIVIPDTVISIDENAFNGCSSLTSIFIPSSVKNIGKDAFRNCDNLTSIIFGGKSQLESIEDGAFYNCNKLKNIYYLGIKTEWSKISLGISNSDLSEATVYYYSKTKPTTSGKYWHYDEKGNPIIW